MDRGLISQGTVDYDKYRVLSHFVGSRIIQYLYLEKEVSFDLVTVKKILLSIVLPTVNYAGKKQHLTI